MEKHNSWKGFSWKRGFQFLLAYASTTTIAVVVVLLITIAINHWDFKLFSSLVSDLWRAFLTIIGSMAFLGFIYGVNPQVFSIISLSIILTLLLLASLKGNPANPYTTNLYNWITTNYNLDTFGIFITIVSLLIAMMPYYARNKTENVESPKKESNQVDQGQTVKPNAWNERIKLSMLKLKLFYKNWVHKKIGFFGSIGLLFVIFSFLWLFTASKNSMDFFFGFEALGLGLIAIGIADKSDEKIQAIAGLEFDDKMGVLNGYSVLIRDKPEQVMSVPNEKIYSVVNAVFRLRKWLSDDEKMKFKNLLSEMQSSLKKWENVHYWKAFNFDVLFAQLKSFEEDIDK